MSIGSNVNFMILTFLWLSERCKMNFNNIIIISTIRSDFCKDILEFIYLKLRLHILSIVHLRKLLDLEIKCKAKG